MSKPKKIDTDRKSLRLSVSVRLGQLMSDAMQCGLPITSRAIHNAIKATGWEQAGETAKAATYAPNMERP